MLDSSWSREAVVQRVVQGLNRRPSFSSFLLEVPPGCNYPDIIMEVYQAFARCQPEDVLCAQITVDHFPNEQALVDALIRQWINRNQELTKQWQEELDYAEDSAVPQRLMSFANFISSAFQLRLVAFFKQFNKVFRGMSSELLAAMRDLEHAGYLACVNASPLTYEALYQQRAREAPTFTSDYGQVHIRLTVGLHSRDSALKIWREQFDLPADDSTHLAYFDIAYEASGGLPAAFEKAVREIIDPDSLEEGIPFYRSRLTEILPESFYPLLRDNDKGNANKLIDSLASVYLGTATTTDYQRIRNHRWGMLLLCETAGALRLRCEALGCAALVMLRSQQTHDWAEPEMLYEQGQYLACCQALKQSSVRFNPVLAVAVEMLAEVFKDSPHSLYFRADVHWGRVKALAKQAAEMCANDASREEFEGWYRIAEIYMTLPGLSRTQIEAHLQRQQTAGRQGIEEAAIHLGIRLLAIERDQNTLSAAYIAIPLVEDILRHYVVLVLRLPPDGRAFTNADDALIAYWWGSGSFQCPYDSRSLKGIELAVLAAAISAQRNMPLFESQEDLGLIRSSLSSIRNLLSHYTITPRDDTIKDLIRSAKALLKKMCTHGDCSITLDRIQRQVQPPRRFLAQ